MGEMETMEERWKWKDFLLRCKLQRSSRAGSKRSERSLRSKASCESKQFLLLGKSVARARSWETKLLSSSGIKSLEAGRKYPEHRSSCLAQTAIFLPAKSLQAQMKTEDRSQLANSAGRQSEIMMNWNYRKRRNPTQNLSTISSDEL